MMWFFFVCRFFGFIDMVLFDLRKKKAESFCIARKNQGFYAVWGRKVTYFKSSKIDSHGLLFMGCDFFWIGVFFTWLYLLIFFALYIFSSVYSKFHAKETIKIKISYWLLWKVLDLEMEMLVIAGPPQHSLFWKNFILIVNVCLLWHCNS